MKDDIKVGDLVTLKSFVHRKNWENIGIVQMRNGSYVTVRWINFEEGFNQPDLSRFPVTQREVSELVGYEATDAAGESSVERNYSGCS